MHPEDTTPPDANHGLYLTRDGRWLHDGDEVGHARLCALLHRSIALTADGALVVTTGRDVMPFACEDTPLRILAVAESPDGLQLTLSNEQTVALERRPLRMDEDGSLRCRTPAGLWARFSRESQWQLHPWIVEEGDGFMLRVNAHQWRVEKASR